MEEVLNERKQKILKAIIKTYMETGEPVGSRTISKYADLNVSSATIRNEMSDLTDMGYIVQPHTSAGRIPSDKGYRLYVNELMKEKEAEVAELRDLIIEKTDKMDKVLKKVAKVLASNTNYATMVSVPQYSGNKIKFIQLSRMSELQLVAVVDPVMQSQYVALFQTGWFLESMWTQVLILHFLRTRKIPFVQSSPSIPVVCTTFAGIIVFTSLTFTKSAGVIGLTKLPIMYFLFLFVVVLLYMLLTTVVKTVYQKKYHGLI